jgi:steroid delta-isomerase-like uncharacterized protein
MAKMPMDIEEWAKHLLAAWTSHDVEKILSFYADDCVFQDFAIGRILNGKKALRAYLEESFTNLPDFRIEAKSSFASGDRVCIEWIMSGTRGSLPGMAIINKKYFVPGVAVIELAQGKARREADYWDSASMMRQLGLLPEAMATDPFVGTWKVNLAKSKLEGLGLKSGTIYCEILGNGIKSGFEGVDIEGKPYRSEWSGQYDGKDYPAKGNPTIDTSAMEKIDMETIVEVCKKAGKEVARFRYTVSKDGKTLHATGMMIDPKGQECNVTYVCDKQ